MLRRTRKHRRVATCRLVQGSSGTAAVSASVTTNSRRGLLRLIAIRMRSRLQRSWVQVINESHYSAQIVEPFPV